MKYDFLKEEILGRNILILSKAILGACSIYGSKKSQIEEITTKFQEEKIIGPRTLLIFDDKKVKEKGLEIPDFSTYESLN